MPSRTTARSRGLDPFLAQTTGSRAADDSDPRLRQAEQPASAASSASPTRRCCSGSIPTGDAIALLSLPRDLKVDIPGVRHRQDQRRLLARRSQADTPRRSSRSPASTGQPPRERRLHGLRPGGERDRLRLRRRRPPLLHRAQLGHLRDQPAARIPGALRIRRALLRPLPPHGQRHRPRRPPADVPAGGTREGPAREADRGPQEAGQDLHHLHLLGHRLRRGDAPGAEAVLRPPRRPDQGDPLQRAPSARRTSRRRRRRSTRR